MLRENYIFVIIKNICVILSQDNNQLHDPRMMYESFQSGRVSAASGRELAAMLESGEEWLCSGVKFKWCGKRGCLGRLRRNFNREERILRVAFINGDTSFK
ncbi:hypothetical protein V6Z11_A03G220500 [Gossypium hirsutum]